jgi:hypothetical protein
MSGAIAPTAFLDDPAHVAEISESAYAVEHDARVAGHPGAPPGCSETNEPIPVPNECPDVGMAQAGTGEDAVTKRATSF